MALEDNILSYQDAKYSVSDIKQIFIDLTGISAETTIVANTDSLAQVQILSIVLGSDTTAVFTIKSGTDSISSIPLLANTPFNEHSDDSGRPVFAGSLGDNISITPSVEIVNGGVYVQYATVKLG